VGLPPARPSGQCPWGQLVDSEGQVSLAQSYDPFGVPFEASGSGASDFGYTGEWWDSYTELLFLRARYYDPAVGRFLSEDTKPGIAYLPKSLNIYAYGWNNPVSFTDPSGLQPPPPACDDPNESCNTSTPALQGTPAPQPVMTPPTPSGTPRPPTPEPTSEGNPFGGTHLATACYILYEGDEREACLARVYQLPVQNRYIGNMCVAPGPQAFILDPDLVGDPFSSPGTGDRKYSYFKAQAHLITGFFIAAADDLEDLPGIIGGTYRSELQAEVTVYEKGTLIELRENYDATNLHGAGLGIDVSVAREVEVVAIDLSSQFRQLFEPVSAGDSGTTEKKKVWMSTSEHHYPDEAVMRIVMFAENSLPLGPAGHGVQYSMSLRP
jgi:RHS repeat-associated protein